MTDDQLTGALVERLLGWKSTVERFVKSGRSWIPRWRFAPLVRLPDAFHLLEHSGAQYIISKEAARFTVRVELDGRAGKTYCHAADGLARAMTTALALAAGLSASGKWVSDVKTSAPRGRKVQS